MKNKSIIAKEKALRENLRKRKSQQQARKDKDNRSEDKKDRK